MKKWIYAEKFLELLRINNIFLEKNAKFCEKTFENLTKNIVKKVENQKFLRYTMFPPLSAKIQYKNSYQKFQIEKIISIFCFWIPKLF